MCTGTVRYKLKLKKIHWYIVLKRSDPVQHGPDLPTLPVPRSAARTLAWERFFLKFRQKYIGCWVITVRDCAFLVLLLTFCCGRATIKMAFTCQPLGISTRLLLLELCLDVADTVSFRAVVYIYIHTVYIYICIFCGLWSFQKLFFLCRPLEDSLRLSNLRWQPTRR